MSTAIAVLPGDGVGPEVAYAAVECLRAIADRYMHDFRFVEAPFGGAAIDLCGDPLPESTLALCASSDAVLLGAVGGDKWASLPNGKRPEDGLLRLRRSLGLFANIRPVLALPSLADVSPLRAELLHGVDFVVVRELTGGIYFGEKCRNNQGASDMCEYTVTEIERVARVAMNMASSRRGLVTSVDKANVLETSRLWRSVVARVAREEYPSIILEHMLVDAAAMHLIRSPTRFDVVVTENMFGDILTDEAAAIAGSIGMLPSASLRGDRFGLYEPIHGSAPDIACQGIANPAGAILSAAMLLRHSLGLPIEADDLEKAVHSAIDCGVRTPDLGTPIGRAASTQTVRDYIVHRVHRADPHTGERAFVPVM